MDYPILGSLSGTGPSYCSWTPIRPVVVPFPMFQHWYLQATAVANRDCLTSLATSSCLLKPSLPFDANFASYKQLRWPRFPQSAFSPVSSFESKISDESNGDFSRRESGFSDSFFSLSFGGSISSPSRSPENPHCRSVSEFLRSPGSFEWDSARSDVERDGSFAWDGRCSKTPDKPAHSAHSVQSVQSISKTTGRNASSNLVPLLPNGICTVPLPPLMALMGEAREESKSPDGRSGRSSSSSSFAVASHRKCGRPPKSPKVESPKKLRPLRSKDLTPPVSPPVDENPHRLSDSPRQQSPTMLFSVMTDRLATEIAVNLETESMKEKFRCEKSEEISLTANSHFHSNLKFKNISEKNGRRKRSKRPLESGSDLPERTNRGPNKGSNKWRSYVCKTCDRFFQYPRSLLTHQLVHQDIRPHKCTFPSCSKAFRQTGHLQTHLLIHTGDKPFRCPVDGCPTLPFRHANRRCPIHTDIRLKKVLVAVEKPLDLSLHSSTNSELSLIPAPDLSSSGSFPESTGREDMAQAAMALLHFATSAV